MDDYISRAEAVALAMEYCPDDDGSCPKVGHDLRELLDDLENAPPANVRPVKEGHWVKARGSWFTPGGDPVWECSECGKGIHVYGIEHGTYGSDIADGQWVSCPNCGAMMGETTWMNF